MTEFGIQVEDVTFQYPSRDVLRGVTFSVRKGELVAILGPNGSGKTTLLRTISGYCKPRKGCVYINGADLACLSANDLSRQVGVVTQSPAFDFAFTVMEYVLMGRTPHIPKFQREKPRDYEVAHKAIIATGLDGLESRLVTELSGGEQRRAAIARALAQEPEILLLDEPTANLDINYQVSVMALLRSLARKRNMAVVAVLHDINLASSYCDRIILMKEGKVHSAGEPASVLTRENLTAVYRSEINVTFSPSTGRPFVVPVSSPASGNVSAANGRNVFVIGGGGSAAGLLGQLVESGMRVQAGVLNVGDADWLTSRLLGIDVIEEEPFGPVSQISLERAKAAAERSDSLVIAAAPFGRGNIANLEIAVKALQSGKLVIVIGADGITARDWTGGKASLIINRLVSEGAISVSSDADALKILCGRQD